MSEIIGFIQANGELTAGGTLLLVVLLILVGLLVPYRQHKQVIAERDAWKDAHATSEKARIEMAGEQYKMLETMRISKVFYKDFVQPVPHSETPQSGGTVSAGGPDVVV